MPGLNARADTGDGLWPTLGLCLRRLLKPERTATPRSNGPPQNSTRPTTIDQEPAEANVFRLIARGRVLDPTVRIADLLRLIAAMWFDQLAGGGSFFIHENKCLLAGRLLGVEMPQPQCGGPIVVVQRQQRVTFKLPQEARQPDSPDPDGNEQSHPVFPQVGKADNSGITW